MSYNGTDLSPDPLFLQSGSYDARSDRKTTSDEIAAGVVGAGDYAVTYSGGTLVLNVAAGAAYIRGGNIADQGSYRQYISSSSTVTCPVADPSNPRIDTIILRTFDNAADSSGLNKGRVECVPGTPTSGATLGNLNGRNALSSLTDLSLSFIVLAYVLVPAGATTLTSTLVNVKDGRINAKLGTSSVGFDPLISGGFMNLEQNTNAETDWFGTAGSGILIPTQFLKNPHSRVVIEGMSSLTLTGTPTHRWRLYGLGYGTGVLAVGSDTGIYTPYGASASSANTYMVNVRIVMQREFYSFNQTDLIGVSWTVETSDPTGAAMPGGAGGTIKPSIRISSGTSFNAPADTATTWPIRFTHQFGTANVLNAFNYSGSMYKVYAE